MVARLRACARRLTKPKLAPTGPDESALVFIHTEDKTAALLHLAQGFAPAIVPLLLSGEAGTGKEVLARLVHRWSGRAGAFVAVNCATLTAASAEMQLFGQRENSLIGAPGDSLGAVHAAAGGTLLLAEISELSLNAQSKLLSLVERGEISPINMSVPEYVDVRLIAATNRNLAALVEQGSFRADLYYRLSAFEIEIPPLRERRGDIIALTRHFIAQANERHGKRVRFTSESLELLHTLPLKGNAGELESIIKRAVGAALDETIITVDVMQMLLLRTAGGTSIADPWANFSLVEEVRAYEAKYIELALREAQGSVSRAARLLGFKHHASFVNLLKTRHRKLFHLRTPPVRRRRSITRRSPK